MPRLSVFGQIWHDARQYAVAWRRALRIAQLPDAATAYTVSFHLPSNFFLLFWRVCVLFPPGRVTACVTLRGLCRIDEGMGLVLIWEPSHCLSSASQKKKPQEKQDPNDSTRTQHTLAPMP